MAVHIARLYDKPVGRERAWIKTDSTLYLCRLYTLLCFLLLQPAGEAVAFVHTFSFRGADTEREKNRVLSPLFNANNQASSWPRPRER